MDNVALLPLQMEVLPESVAEMDANVMIAEPVMLEANAVHEPPS